MRTIATGFVMVALGIWAACVVRAQSAAGDRAKVMDSYGTVQKRFGVTAKWENVNVGDLLAPSTSVKTGSNSAVLLQLPDKHVVRVGASTTVELRELGKDRSYVFNVTAGKVWSFVQSASKPARYDVETPSAVAGVAGTLFSVFYDEEDDETTVSADEGEVNVRQGNQTARVGKGHFARFSRKVTASGHAEFGKAMPQPDRVKGIWSLMRKHEEWMTPGEKFRLNRDRHIEKHLEEMDRQRRVAIGKSRPRAKEPPSKTGAREHEKSKDQRRSPPRHPRGKAPRRGR